MASLADELDFDPAFDDANLGASFSYEEEQEGGSSVDQSPIRTRGGRGARRGRGGARDRYSSDEEEQQGPSQGGLGEGFSLADELGGGNEQPLLDIGSSLAEEVVEYTEYGSERSPAKGGDLDEETKARKDREYYLTSSESLNASLRTTETFLAKLKQTSSAPGIVQHGSSMPSAQSASSLFGTGGPSDDTSTLEGRAGQMLKQMREHSNAREDQIRELQECDRLLRRALEEGGDWINALANVDDFESESLNEESNAEDDSIPDALLSKHSNGRRSDNDSLWGDIAMLDENEGLRSTDLSTLLARLPLSNLAINDQQQKPNWTGAPIMTICQELVSLQHFTSDLIVSLGSLHEQSQVARASMNDAARRIKTIKTVLNNWNAEIEAAEQSQSHILSWESSGIESGSRPKDIREWTASHMNKFQRILDDASIRARELLSPVQDSVLDRLVAQG